MERVVIEESVMTKKKKKDGADQDFGHQTCRKSVGVAVADAVVAAYEGLPTVTQMMSSTSSLSESSTDDRSSRGAARARVVSALLHLVVELIEIN